MNRHSRLTVLLLPVLFAMNGCALLKGSSASLRNVRLPPSQVGQLAPANALAAARSMLAKEDYTSAIALFRQIPIEAAESAAAANGLAIAYDALGRHDLAQRYFEQAMGLDAANESYRRNYDRFAATNNARALALAGGAARPVENNSSNFVRDRETLIRLSLSDVRLQTLAPTRIVATLAPPAEIHLVLTGSGPKLDAPRVASTASPASRPIFTANATDLAQAVRAARLRIGQAENSGTETKRCSHSAAPSCAS